MTKDQARYWWQQGFDCFEAEQYESPLPRTAGVEAAIDRDFDRDWEAHEAFEAVANMSMTEVDSLTDWKDERD